VAEESSRRSIVTAEDIAISRPAGSAEPAAIRAASVTAPADAGPGQGRIQVIVAKGEKPDE
jgi:hypothetical protein